MSVVRHFSNRRVVEISIVGWSNGWTAVNHLWCVGETVRSQTSSVLDIELLFVSPGNNRPISVVVVSQVHLDINGDRLSCFDM